MKINRSAWSAFQSGTTSRQLKTAAKAKADHFLLWLAISLGLWAALSWAWALAPAIMAALSGAQSFDARKLIPEMEALENLIGRNTSR